MGQADGNRTGLEKAFIFRKAGEKGRRNADVCPFWTTYLGVTDPTSFQAVR